MNSEFSAFEYDDFEQYLLDAATIDEAPADLPARLGVALGLGVPILAATQVASLAPTTTSVNGSFSAAGTVAPGGLFSALKSSLGAGATTLWGTAVKGIAVGLIAGTGLLGTGRAFTAWMGTDASSGTRRVNATVQSKSPRPKPNDTLVLAPAGALLPTEPGTQTFTPESAETSLQNGAKSLDSGMPNWRAAAGSFSDRSQPEPPEEVERPKRRGNWKFPEKTYAVARYPILLDDVSAYYDTPKRQRLASVAAFESEPSVSPAEVQTQRGKTIQQCQLLLGQGRAPAALAELDQYRSHVGDRNFGIDERLLRIEALATMGRAKEAQADVKDVARLAPNSAALRQAQKLANSRFVR